MTRARRLLVAGLLAGAVIRAAALPLPGTGDVLVWKVWSFAASYDVTGMYGVGGSPPEHRLLHWRGNAMTVDYPPLALYELAAVGSAYRWFHPVFDDSRALDVWVKLPGLLAEIALVAGILIMGHRALSDAERTWAALAFWLNPAVLMNGAVLGYLDAQMAVPLTAAFAAAWFDYPLAAGVLAASAILTKAQAVFALPVIVAIVGFRRSPSRVAAIARLSIGGLAVAALAVLPYVARGAWSNLRQAVGRLATHDMLSAQAANVWWIFTWVLRVIDARPYDGWRAALTQETRILAITRAMELGYPNARVVGLVIVGALVAWASVRARRLTEAADAFALGAWCLYAYALFAAQVHENHLYAAVPLLLPGAALAPDYRRPFWLLTFIVAANLYLFYGLGGGWPPLVSRRITGIDATVVVSIVNVATFVWLTAVVATRTSAEAPATAR